MATRVGIHAERLSAVRTLRSVKGRREQHRFTFEGATLLEEAVRSGYPIDEIYCTETVYESSPQLQELDAGGVPTFIVPDRAAQGISNVATPSGLVVVASVRFHRPEQLFQMGGVFLMLADVNDPANAGTLLRSADAFGCSGTFFGRLGVDPYHPKVVRASVGAVFRVPVSLADPEAFATSAAAALRIFGLAAHGAPLDELQSERPIGLVVGNERHGLGRWEALCERVLGIPMAGRAESLSAAVAGSIALYEATRRRVGKAPL
jgi:RNA methyltransferase, TrmH family